MSWLPVHTSLTRRVLFSSVSLSSFSCSRSITPSLSLSLSLSLCLSRRPVLWIFIRSSVGSPFPFSLFLFLLSFLEPFPYLHFHSLFQQFYLVIFRIFARFCKKKKKKNFTTFQKNRNKAVAFFLLKKKKKKKKKIVPVHTHMDIHIL